MFPWQISVRRWIFNFVISFHFANLSYYQTGGDPSKISHPLQLKSTLSSSFIPYCAYQTNLNFSKTKLTVPGLTFPLCSSFLPTILEGQLCYKLTLNETSGGGKRNALMFLLDYNNDLWLSTASVKGGTKKSSKEILNLGTSVESIQAESAKMQINTISPYIGFGGGLYKMTDVKRMTAKKEFLNMPMKDRQCKVDCYEDCGTKKLLKECNCSPWEFGSHVGSAI